MSEDVSTGSGNAGAATRGWMRALALALVPSVAFMLYQLAYQVTKPSPLSRASWSELVPVVGFTVVVAVCTAVVATGVALLVNTLASRITGRHGSSLGTLLVTGALYAVALVAFLENFVYSATGRGMKTGDEILPKIVFLTFAVTLGFLLALRMARMAERSVRVVLVGTGLLLVPSVVLTAQNLASTPPAPPLAVAEGRTVDPLNVVILSSDGIDADRTSVYGYERQTTPFLDEKRSEFRVFENAFANNGNTTGSITSLLNGMSPLSTQVVIRRTRSRSRTPTAPSLTSWGSAGTTAATGQYRTTRTRPTRTSSMPSTSTTASRSPVLPSTPCRWASGPRDGSSPRR